MAQKTCEKFSTALIIRETQFKITMRYHFTPITSAKKLNIGQDIFSYSVIGSYIGIIILENYLDLPNRICAWVKGRG